MDVGEQYNKIYRYCYMKTRDHHISEDLTQETFLRFLENHSYREIGKQTAYLYVTARNLCNDYFRSGGRQELPLEAAPEAEDYLAKASFAKVELEDALYKLEKEEREMLLLRYVNEESIGKIAELFQMSRFSVYRRIQAALTHLKEVYDDQEPFKKGIKKGIPGTGGREEGSIS